MSNYRKDEIESLAAAFKALSNPHRLRIFLRLAACCGPAGSGPEAEPGTCVRDVGADLDIAPSTVSHHLKELRTAGLIDTERCGQSVSCRVDPKTLNRLGEMFRTAAGSRASRSENRRMWRMPMTVNSADAIRAAVRGQLCRDGHPQDVVLRFEPGVHGRMLRIDHQGRPIRRFARWAIPTPNWPACRTTPTWAWAAATRPPSRRSSRARRCWIWAAAVGSTASSRPVRSVPRGAPSGST